MFKIPFYRSLAGKLFVVMSTMLMLAIAVNAYQNGSYFYAQLLLETQENTMQNARLAANGANAVLTSWIDQIGIVTNCLNGLPQERYAGVIKNIVGADSDFVGFELWTQNNDKLTALVSAPGAAQDDERFMGQDRAQVLGKLHALIRAQLERLPVKAAPSTVLVKNLAPKLQLPILLLAVPFNRNGSGDHIWAVLAVWQTKLFTSLATWSKDDVNLVDREGGLISASRPERLTAKLSFASHPLVREIAQNDSPTVFMEWGGKSQTKIFGAAAQIPALHLAVVTETSADPLYQAVRQIIKRTVLWALLLVLIVALLSLLSAAHVTRKLDELSQAAMHIADGNFHTRVAIASKDEVGVLSFAVNHMSAQIENLMTGRLERARIATELQTAKLVQETFLPKTATGDRDLRVASFYRPASECGGDWWGEYNLSASMRLVCIGDATGHGVPAALVTAMVFSAASVMTRLLQDKTASEFSPATLLSEINKTLFDSGAGKTNMTFMAALIDMETGMMTIANGGHNFPLLLPEAGDVAGGLAKNKELRIPGHLMGINYDSVFVDKKVQLRPGDRLCFYTDGLIECTNLQGEQWSKRRLRALLQDSSQLDLGQMQQAIVAGAFAHFGDQPTADDVTLVMLEYRARDKVAKTAPVPVSALDGAA